MRHKRLKSARKTLRYFALNGNIKPPYKVLLDGPFLVMASQYHIPIQERILKLLQEQLPHPSYEDKKKNSGSDYNNNGRYNNNKNNRYNNDNKRNNQSSNSKKMTSFYTTRSVIIELGNLIKIAKEGEKKNDKKTNSQEVVPQEENKFLRAQKLALRLCEIIETRDIPASVDNDNKKEQPQSSSSSKEGGKSKKKSVGVSSPASQDILSLVSHENNSNGYFVATQDDDLAHILRTKILHVPLLKISRTVLLLENPSVRYKQQVEKMEGTKRLHAGGLEEELISKLKQAKQEQRDLKQKEYYQRQDQRNQYSSGTNTFSRQKRKASQPNPLSCKKKKTDNSEGNKKKVTAGEKKRRRKKNNSTTTSS